MSIGARTRKLQLPRSGPRFRLTAVAVDERQHLAVVHDGVHALDPERVDGSVEDEPLLVGAVVSRKHAEDGGEDAVRPLHRPQVVAAVELVH
jgi:hypothetical protein